MGIVKLLDYFLSTDPIMWHKVSREKPIKDSKISKNNKILGYIQIKYNSIQNDFVFYVTHEF